jgi:DNA polymerase-1
MAKSLYIIDGHAHIYAAYFAPMSQRLTSPSGEPTKATYIFTNTILGLIADQKPDMLIVAMDSKTPSFRKKIYKEYKAHRPPMPDDMPVQINRIEQILDALNIPVLRVDGFEADDVIGTVAKAASKNGIDTYICAKDKDMYQLVDEHIHIYDVKKGESLDDKTLFEKYKFEPHHFVDVLALEGDASDNVPGVPLIGEMNAIKLIQQFGSLDDLYKNVDKIEGKRGENLRKFKEQAYLSKELMIINTKVPVDIDYKKFKLKEPDKQKLAGVFTELGFNRLITQLGLTQTQDTRHPAFANATAGKQAQDSKREASDEQPATNFGTPDSVKTVSHDYQLIDTAEKFDSFFADLKKQKLFAIDTETTSLSPMAAQLAGISFSWQAHKAYYLPVKASLGQKHLDINLVREKLAPILADENIKKVGQNIKFDMLILQNAKMPLAGAFFDTMVASYCLDPTRTSHSMDSMSLDFLGYEGIPISSLIGKGKNQLTFDMVDTAAACEYSGEDADITFQLYRYFTSRLEAEPAIKKLFEEVEMPLVSVLVTMEFNGVSLDVGLLKKMSGEIAEIIQRLCDQIYKLTGAAFNIDSPKQLAEILFDKMHLQSLRIGKGGRSTDADVLDQLKGQHKVIPLILEYRQLSKLQNTYVDKLPFMINPKTGRLHTSFNQTITETGRLSSSNPNLQNIPIRTELGRKIRSAFIPAKKTDCILSADYSQIELRLLAHFSKDKTLLKAFEEDRDIHRFVASQIYGIPIEQVTDEMRSHCKAVNFGIIYGQGAFGLSQTVGISQADAKKFIEDYFARYSSIRAFLNSVIESARRSGFAETILHRRRILPDIKSKNANKRNQSERMAINTVIQGSAADLIKVAMINIQRKIEHENLSANPVKEGGFSNGVKMILQIHDELVFELPADKADTYSKWISKEMTTAIKLDVPLKVDISIGPSWQK